MLGLYRSIHKLLASLLELFLGRLRVSAGNPCLVFYLDVNGLTWVRLALGGLIAVAYSAIHRVVHNTSVEGVGRLIGRLLSGVARNDRATYYTQRTRILRLALLLERTLHWTTHRDISGGIFLGLPSL
jgi:hypothetical protein